MNVCITIHTYPCVKLEFNIYPTRLRSIFYFLEVINRGVSSLLLKRYLYTLLICYSVLEYSTTRVGKGRWQRRNPNQGNKNIVFKMEPVN
jgi:hypothetical protein